MTNFAEALIIVRNTARLLPSEMIAVQNARGRILASAVSSQTDIPRFANSAMDGFAVPSAATPGRFEIVEQLAAGDQPGAHSVSTSRAIEIMTGAPIPPGADAVVKVEDAIREGATVRVPLAAASQNVRAAGEDYHAGDLVVAKGTRLTPEHLMAIAQTGTGVVAVNGRPRVSIIPTGREIEQAGAPLPTTASIWSSSAIYLQTALENLGCSAQVMPIIRDDPSAFVTALDQAFACSDLVLTTGAISMGAFDFIPAALDRRGARTLFRKLAVRPAKPVLFAELEDRLVFGLPGNPISTAVAFRFLVWPALGRMMGALDEAPQRLALSESTKKPVNMRCFFKAHVERDRVTVTAGQGSHLVRPLAMANAWAVLAEDGDRVESGELVDVYPLQPFGAW